ncbi:hypothetical protein FHU41_002188 [Psychromicrobium silvestre]|uniref:Uncharacterized protein n=1 Tax=Psychromicrobium silvestre TaxID=1645614 RepID=A0A7Y9LUN5_9MICC|nr:hypothetical protein [Psychromicrobium silvestre]
MRIVVRALPAAAQSGWQELLEDYNSALQANCEKAAKKALKTVRSSTDRTNGGKAAHA